MAVKYQFEYTDIEGVLHEVTISNVDYVLAPITIKGSVIYGLSNVDAVDESIRGTGLILDLEASTSRTFSDLYTEQERVFEVQYTRDSIITFNGWLSSEGFYEDFVSDKWNMSLECTDGLSFLSDLSYVDSSGITFSGNQSQLEIIVNCLNRTGISQNINTNIDIYYTGLSTSLDVLDNVYFNSDRFIKDDGETIMSCEEVLRDVLEPYNASIMSFKGEWYIYKLNQLFSDDTPTFFRYLYDGTANAPTTKIVDVSFDLGSQIDSYYPHHVNSNQASTNNKSIGAYRISYKYGLVQSLISNINLVHNGVTIDEWTINSSTNLTLNASGQGVDLDFDATPSVKNLTSDVISLNADDLINFSIRVKTTSLTKNTQLVSWGLFNYKIILTGGSTYYYNPFAVPAEWSLVDTTLLIFGGELDNVSSGITSLPPIPINGDLTVEIYTPTQNTDETGTFTLQELSISPADEADDTIKGEFHTFQREDNPSTNIKDTKQVNNGDNPSDIYYGTIYKTDGTTPTETWFRKGVTESIPLLQLMGEETLRLSQSTSREFTGDVYGYVEPLSVVTINNISGIYVIKACSNNTVTNVANCIFSQIFSGELTDIAYEKTIDYGNTVKPTIRG